MGENAEKDILNLSQNGLTTIILVFLILVFILKTKDAFIAAIGIPISFLVSFIFFLLVGNTINFISLFSMILAIGILVDSDIVITEGIAKRKNTIKKKHAELSNDEQEILASKLAIKDLAGPMLAGTATTIAVFAPLLFLSGVTGDFIKNIPFTIIFILLASQIVSVFFIPLLHSISFKKIKLPKKIKLSQKVKIKKFNFEKVERRYEVILSYFLRNKKRGRIFILGIITFFILTLILPISGILKSQFFPGGDVNFIYLNIEMERGSSKYDVSQYTTSIEKELENLPFYTSIVSTVGETSGGLKKIRKYGDRFGNILINIKDEEKGNG
jgi:multidrug efflux pump